LLVFVTLQLHLTLKFCCSYKLEVNYDYPLEMNVNLTLVLTVMRFLSAAAACEAQELVVVVY
jgi:hypothetical protein